MEDFPSCFARTHLMASGPKQDDLRFADNREQVIRLLENELTKLR